MVIIRCRAATGKMQLRELADYLQAQASQHDIVVVPSFCEVLAVTDDSTGLQIIQKNADPRVEQLEKELAAALADLSAAPSCETCKHEGPPAYSCMGADGNCHSCITKACPCRGCENGSGWEWRGACEPV